MPYDTETLRRIYERTAGRCHLCGKQVCFNNYGDLEGRGGWEVEHSTPRAKGGTDHGNNLYPTCIPCNRTKGTFTTRTVRGWHGRTRAPLSKERQEAVRESNAWAGAIIGGIAALAVNQLMKPTEPHDGQAQQGRPISIMPVILTVLVVAVVGAIIAYNLNAEN